MSFPSPNSIARTTPETTFFPIQKSPERTECKKILHACIRIVEIANGISDENVFPKTFILPKE